MKIYFGVKKTSCLQRILFTIIIFLFPILLLSQETSNYKLPPKEILELVLAKPTPQVNIDSKGEWLLILERNAFPTVEELGQPELKIAGLRINPKNFGPSRDNSFSDIKLQNVKSKEVISFKGLPYNLRAANFSWSPNEEKIAFINITNSGIDLYILDIKSRSVSKINKSAINAILGRPFSWIGNDKLLYSIANPNNISFPEKPSKPDGPTIQENLGKVVPSRTFQDLIKNNYDENAFEYLATTQMVINDLKEEIKIGSQGIFLNFSVSPNYEYIMYTQIQKPFSYLVPVDAFPASISVIDLKGNLVKELANNPSGEGAPIGFDDVIDFPRSFSWRADEPATAIYIKAVDKGLGKSKSEFRDAIYSYNILTKVEKELFRTTKRFQSIFWGNNEIALFTEQMFATKKMRLNLFNPSTGKVDSIFERSSNDLYNDIGIPLTQRNKFGRESLVILDKNNIILRSQGASPNGDLPFIQSLNLKTGKKELWWRCEEPYYENFAGIVNLDKRIFITSRESLNEPPNYFIRNFNKKTSIEKITNFQNPYKILEGIKKEKISYQREDGINLTGNLYLPKNYDPAKDGPLPILMWAYPIEYRNAADANQVRGSKYTFTRINYGSPIFWITQGFAVLDNAEMPIIGEGKNEPNDNFIPQLYLNAHAAIKTLSERGVGDSNRVAVGGHSYGAFMTANLLAHTKLFKAGIARSGAYNRTLTPFGFQSEERTYWQAPKIYFDMSPFSFANKIKTPILLIHGDADNNSGTFPIQSERFYNAIKGHGGIVRFVLLPFESHGYAGKENILHMLWETDSWLKKYVK